MQTYSSSGGKHFKEDTTSQTQETEMGHTLPSSKREAYGVFDSAMFSHSGRQESTREIPKAFHDQISNQRNGEDQAILIQEEEEASQTSSGSSPREMETLYDQMLEAISLTVKEEQTIPQQSEVEIQTFIKQAFKSDDSLSEFINYAILKKDKIPDSAISLLEDLKTPNQTDQSITESLILREKQDCFKMPLPAVPIPQTDRASSTKKRSSQIAEEESELRSEHQSDTQLFHSFSQTGQLKKNWLQATGQQSIFLRGANNNVSLANTLTEAFFTPGGTLTSNQMCQLFLKNSDHNSVLQEKQLNQANNNNISRKEFILESKLLLEQESSLTQREKSQQDSIKKSQRVPLTQRDQNQQSQQNQHIKQVTVGNSEMTEEKSVAMVKAVPMNEQSIKDSGSKISFAPKEEEEEEGEEELELQKLGSNDQSIKTEDIGLSLDAKSPPQHLRKDTCTRQLCFSSSQKVNQDSSIEEESKGVPIEDSTLQLNKESELQSSHQRHQMSYQNAAELQDHFNYTSQCLIDNFDQNLKQQHSYILKQKQCEDKENSVERPESQISHVTFNNPGQFTSSMKMHSDGKKSQSSSQNSQKSENRRYENHVSKEEEEEQKIEIMPNLQLQESQKDLQARCPTAEFARETTPQQQNNQMIEQYQEDYTQRIRQKLQEIQTDPDKLFSDEESAKSSCRKQIEQEEEGETSEDKKKDLDDSFDENKLKEQLMSQKAKIISQSNLYNGSCDPSIEEQTIMEEENESESGADTDRQNKTFSYNVKRNRYFERKNLRNNYATQNSENRSIKQKQNLLKSFLDAEIDNSQEHKQNKSSFTNNSHNDLHLFSNPTSSRKNPKQLELGLEPSKQGTNHADNLFITPKMEQQTQKIEPKSMFFLSGCPEQDLQLTQKLILTTNEESKEATQQQKAVYLIDESFESSTYEHNLSAQKVQPVLATNNNGADIQYFSKNPSVHEALMYGSNQPLSSTQKLRLQNLNPTDINLRSQHQPSGSQTSKNQNYALERSQVTKDSFFSQEGLQASGFITSPRGFTMKNKSLKETLQVLQGNQVESSQKQKDLSLAESRIIKQASNKLELSFQEDRDSFQEEQCQKEFEMEAENDRQKPRMGRKDLVRASNASEVIPMELTELEGRVPQTHRKKIPSDSFTSQTKVKPYKSKEQEEEEENDPANVCDCSSEEACSVVRYDQETGQSLMMNQHHFKERVSEENQSHLNLAQAKFGNAQSRQELLIIENYGNGDSRHQMSQVSYSQASQQQFISLNQEKREEFDNPTPEGSSIDPRNLQNSSFKITCLYTIFFQFIYQVDNSYQLATHSDENEEIPLTEECEQSQQNIVNYVRSQKLDQTSDEGQSMATDRVADDSVSDVYFNALQTQKNLIQQETQNTLESTLNTKQFLQEQSDIVAVFRSVKNDIPSFINDKAFIEQREAKLKFLNKYQDCFIQSTVKKNTKQMKGQGETIFFTQNSPFLYQSNLPSIQGTAESKIKKKLDLPEDFKMALNIDTEDLDNSFQDLALLPQSQKNQFLETNQSLSKFLKETNCSLDKHIKIQGSQFQARVNKKFAEETLKTQDLLASQRSNYNKNAEKAISELQTLKTDQCLEMPPDMRDFLKKTKIEHIEEIGHKLLMAGFEDLQQLKDSLETAFPLTLKELEKAGIKQSGARRRILVRLEYESGLFEKNQTLLREMDRQGQRRGHRGRVFHGRNSSIRKSGAYSGRQSIPQPQITQNQPFSILNCCSEANQVILPSMQMQMMPVLPSLREYLSEIRLESLAHNFEQSGFNDVESLYLMVFSDLVPLNDDVLEQEVKIEKLGYRKKILQKLREDALGYLESVGLNQKQQFKIDTTEAEQQACQCVIF